jgi:outer membrane receptor protein involved in Fe transport
VKHYIGSLAAIDSLNNCLNTGDPVYCDLVRRDANGSLSVGNGPTSGRVIATGLNTGSFEMSGPTYDYIDMDVGFDLGSHVNLRLGVNNLFDRQPPIVGFNANPLLVNGNMLAATYDTFGRYLFVGLTAKY